MVPDHVTLPGVGTVRVASIGQRFLGRLLDVLIVGAPSVIIASVVIGIASAHEPHRLTGDEVEPSARFYLSLVSVAGMLFVLAALYEVGLTATRGATIGKQIAGAKVLRTSDGQIPGVGPSFLRWIIPVAAYVVCGPLPLLVYLSPLFDNSGRRQGWHDNVANTIVISTKWAGDPGRW